MKRPAVVLAFTLVLLVQLSSVWAEGTRELIADTDPAGGCSGNNPSDWEDCCEPGSPAPQNCPFQGLRATTQLFVEINEPATERIVFCTNRTPAVQVTVIDPNGATSGPFSSGATITPTSGVAGAYRLQLPLGANPGFANQTGDMYDADGGGTVHNKYWWDVQVFSSVPANPCSNVTNRTGELDGRLYSSEWRFNAGSFSPIADTRGSFFARVPGGTPGETAVIELDLEGLAGFVFEVYGNRNGVSGPDGGRSVEKEGHSVVPEFPMFLNPPENSEYEVSVPILTDFDIGTGFLGCGTEGSPNPMPIVASGVSEVTFSFESNVEGTYQIICDLNFPPTGGRDIGDGEFNIHDNEDLLLLGILEIGTNEQVWDGRTNDGELIPFTPGAGVGSPDILMFECAVRITVGEFHYVASDPETSFPGMRIFQTPSAAGGQTPLDMFWNDTPVQRCAVPLNGQAGVFGAETSGADGVSSAGGSVVPYAQTARIGGSIITPVGNARAWGDFVTTPIVSATPPCPTLTAGNGKGNDIFLDTFAWLDDDDNFDNPIVLYSIDPNLDSDDDDCIDFAEICDTGTNPNDTDSDDDCVDDFTDTNSCTPGNDTDNDGIWNGADPDDDGDCIISCDEGCFDGPLSDTDGNGTPDYLDNDDEGDTVLTALEEPGMGAEGCPAFEVFMRFDSDGDETPNYCDTDDDGDTVPTIVEDHDGDGNPQDDDFDGDDKPDYLDDDDDGDGVLTKDEEDPNNGPLNGDPTDDDTDGDGSPNYLDPNDDGDEFSTVDEDIDGDGDPRNDDTDGDGTPNYLDPDDSDCPFGDSDGDGIICRDDNCPNDPNPGQTDTDGDGVGDDCEMDRDGDGIDDGDDNCPDIPNPGQEDLDGDGIGDVCDDDRDGDGIPNASDNCPDVFNPGQEDFNEDGIGDICQQDSDGDGIPDVVDNCPTIPNTDQGDADGDGFGDVCDDDIDGDLLPNDVEDANGNGQVDPGESDPVMFDTDGGGVDDGTEVARGTDPLDPIDDPGPLQVQGGSVFTCEDNLEGSVAGGTRSGRGTTGASIVMLLMVAALLIGYRRRGA